MNAAELLRKLISAGFNLAAEGAGIRVTPASRLSAADCQDIRRHKAELLEFLRLEDFCRVLEAEEGWPAGSVFSWRPGGVCECGHCATVSTSPH